MWFAGVLFFAKEQKKEKKEAGEINKVLIESKLLLNFNDGEKILFSFSFVFFFYFGVVNLQLDHKQMIVNIYAAQSLTSF